MKETTAYRASLRERIIEKAMQEFSMHGIRAVKMDDLAADLGISKRTLYEIFRDKETLLFEGIKIYSARKQEYMRSYAEDERHHVIDIIMEAYHMKVEEVRSVNPLFYLDLMKYPKLAQHMKESQQESREGFLAFMKRGVDDGYFRPDVNYELVPHIFDALGQYILTNSLVQQYSVEELFSNCFLIALRGFCTDKGLHTIDKLIEEAKSE
ncbi:MAG: TetR/AcrR family transcriptional regulator [Prevotella sp.]|nr:TetR/AcrR family transcriptional regulator [Prevotella sp.]